MGLPQADPYPPHRKEYYMKKIIALAVVCAMMPGGAQGFAAAGANDIKDEFIVSSAAGENKTTADAADNGYNGETADSETKKEAETVTEDNNIPLQPGGEADKSDVDSAETGKSKEDGITDKTEDESDIPESAEKQEKTEETGTEKEPDSTRSPAEENESEADLSANNGIALFSVGANEGTGSYTFDSAGDINGWKSDYAKISWDSTVDATENGGGSLKFEYDIKSGGSGSNIKVGIPAKQFCTDLADGECYTLKYKVYGERVKSGADTFLNITTTDIYKDTYYQIATAVSPKVTIDKNKWKTVSLNYVHNTTIANIEIVFPNGLSKQKNESEYDIYYVDDVTIEKNDTIAPYAEEHDWFKPYEGTGKLLAGSVKLDISETQSIMQTGGTQTTVLYETEVNAGQTGSEIKRKKLTNDRFTFSSEYPEIAEVDENGNISAKSAGYTVITATTGSGANQKTANLLLTVVDNIYAGGNFIMDKPSNAVGRVEDFTGMRDYVYMTFAGRTADENSAPVVSVDVKTPHIASFTLYDTGTADIDMYAQYGNYANRMLEGGGSNTYHNTEYRWLQIPGVSSYVTIPRKEGWHQITVITDYPTEHSVADGYMSKTIYADGKKIGSGDFDCTPYSGAISFWFSKNQLVKEAYVVKCGTDLDIKSVTPNITSGKLADSDSSFTFNFTNSVNPDTVDGNILLNDEVQSIDFKYQLTDKTLVITPDYPLDTEKNYVLTLKKDIAAIAKGASVPGTLDTDRKYRFSTEEYPIEFKEVMVRANKVKGTFSNKSNSDAEVFYVLSVYKDKAAHSVNVYKATIPKKGSLTVTAAADVDKISNYDGYEMFVFRNENSSMGELLNNVYEKAFTAAIGSTGISPQASTSVICGYDPEKEIVEITGQSKSKRMDMPVIMKMYKDGGGSESSYTRIAVIRTGRNGELNYGFKMPEKAEKGIYKIEMTLPFEADGYLREINYIDIEDAKAYLEKIDMQTTAEGVATTEIFNPALDPLRILGDDFNRLANKNFVYNSVLQGKPYASAAQDVVSNFKNLYRNVLAIAAALEGDSDACADTIKENHANGYWGISDNSAFKSFMQRFEKTRRDKVINRLKKAPGYKNVGDLFNAAVITEDILSQNSYATIYSVLSGYNDVLGIDYKDYLKLPESKRLSACEAFYKAVNAAREEISSQGIKEEFEKCVTVAGKYNKPEGGGNTGGTSGGNSGSSGSSSSDIIVKSGSNIGKVPDWYEDESKTASIKVFDDLENVKWAEYSINKLYNLGAISGKAERIFAPNDNIKREELCSIIAKAFKLSEVDGANEMTFSDVEQGKWYTDGVKICYENGVVNGIGDNMFGIGRTVTREEISTILVRAAEASGKTLDYYFTIFPFPDEDEISDWAKNSVAVLHECLIVIGMEDGSFAPKNNVTRAQAAKMIAGLLDFNY